MRLIRQYWTLLAPFHTTFRWFVALLVLYEGMQLLEGYVISLVVRLFSANAEVLIWVVLIVALLVYDELFNRVDNAVDWHIITKHAYPVFKHLKLGAIRKFLEMDVPWHDKRNSGALVGKVANGVWKVQEIIDGLSWEFVPTLIQTILSLIPLLIISSQSAGVAMASFLVFMWMTYKSNKARMPLRETRHDLYEEEWHKSIEMVQAAEHCLMYGQSGRLLKEQELIHDGISNLGLKEARIGIYRYNRWRIRALTWARRSLLSIWIWQLHSGSLDIANLIFVSVLTEKLFHSFWRFARLLDRASEASEGASRLADLMSEKSQYGNEGIKPDFALPVGIKMEDVCFSYQDDYSQDDGGLHGFDLDIPGGSIVAIVGPSGAGKTTLRKVLPGLHKIHSGKIEVAGMDTREWRDDALVALFSYVPQGDGMHIFNTTIRENIAFPKPDASIWEVMEAAKLAGIHDFIMGLPGGYETVVGERGKKLSGGQKQRVALAQAIIADRPILILDEATSSVDAITEREIQQKMRSILHDKTAIIIAHRLSTVWDIADKIVVMDKGRKVEEGTHAQLMRLNGLYAKMVGLQTSNSV